MTDADTRMSITADERAENVALTQQAERPRPLAMRLTLLRRCRVARNASFAEVADLQEAIEVAEEVTALRAQVEQLLDERDNHRYSPADPRLWQMHRLAREASRTDSTGKAVRQARDELLKLALSLFPLEAPHG